MAFIAARCMVKQTSGLSTKGCRRMMLEYAPRGLFGVLTPQANTTVEPELAIMTPVGTAWVNGRLTSRRSTIEERLVDYYDALGDSLTQFANAPVQAVAVACTGASYICGASREDALVAGWSRRAGVPVITAARAVCAMLDGLGARRIGLASPYPAGLNRLSEAYWAERGFEVVASVSAFRETDAFHPIYSLAGSAATQVVNEVRGSGVDAVLMLGTGMPTLQPILVANGSDGPPVISCMLAMTWAAVAASSGAGGPAPDLTGWLTGAHWGGRSRLGS
jgi:maleate isomerase